MPRNPVNPARSALTLSRGVVRNFSNALEWNNTNGQYVDFGNNFNKEWSDAFSWSMWILWRKAGTGNGLIAKKQPQSTPPETGYRWSIVNSNQRFTFFLIGTNGANLINVSGQSGGGTANNIIPQNVWCHVVLTYSGSGTAAGVNFYKNGVLLTKTVTSDTFDNTSILTTVSLKLGGFQQTGTQSPFSGDITDVRLHNVALTAQQVADLYYQNIATNVEAYWPFNDGAGSTLTATVGGVNGTINGTVVWVPSANTPKDRVAVTTPRNPVV